MSSDHSDSEELELWARTVDLPGFDDNVSPHNAITMLLRFVVGEVRGAHYTRSWQWPQRSVLTRVTFPRWW